MLIPRDSIRLPVLGLFALLGLALAGCAAQPGAYGPQAGGTVSSSQGKPLDANLSGFLEQAPPGAVTDLAESPWGANVVVSAEAAYYSASGRVCRQLHIESARGPIPPRVACETPQGWEAKRLVTDTRVGGTR